MKNKIKIANVVLAIGSSVGVYAATAERLSAALPNLCLVLSVATLLVSLMAIYMLPVRQYTIGLGVAISGVIVFAVVYVYLIKNYLHYDSLNEIWLLSGFTKTAFAEKIAAQYQPATPLDLLAEFGNDVDVSEIWSDIWLVQLLIAVTWFGAVFGANLALFFISQAIYFVFYNKNDFYGENNPSTDIFKALLQEILDKIQKGFAQNDEHHTQTHHKLTEIEANIQQRIDEIYTTKVSDFPFPDLAAKKQEIITNWFQNNQKISDAALDDLAKGLYLLDILEKSAFSDYAPTVVCLCKAVERELEKVSDIFKVHLKISKMTLGTYADCFQKVASFLENQNDTDLQALIDALSEIVVIDKILFRKDFAKFFEQDYSKGEFKITIVGTRNRAAHPSEKELTAEKYAQYEKAVKAFLSVWNAHLKEK
jgi:ssDNA-specific exonuclease RecJ